MQSGDASANTNITPGNNHNQALNYLEMGPAGLMGQIIKQAGLFIVGFSRQIFQEKRGIFVTKVSH